MMRPIDMLCRSQFPELIECNAQNIQRFSANKKDNELSTHSITGEESVNQNTEAVVYPIKSIDKLRSRHTICPKAQQIDSAFIQSAQHSFEEPEFKIYSKLIDFRRQLLEYYGYELMNQICTDEVDPYIEIWKCRRLEQDILSKDYMWVTYSCKVLYFKHELRHRALHSLNERLLKDSRLLMQFNHKNVVKVHQTIDLHEPRTALSFYVCSVMDSMDGTLLDLMHSYPKDINECELISKIWFRQIADGIDYLHNRIASGIRVTHLAICATNIVWKLIDPISNHILFKLTNFEDSILFETNEPDIYPYVSIVNTSYCAPEAFRHCLGRATRPMDIYSLGKLLAIHLLKNENKFERFKRFCIQPNDWFCASERRLFTSLTQEVRDLLTDMLWQNPNHRLTAEQVSNHIWLK